MPPDDEEDILEDQELGLASEIEIEEGLTGLVEDKTVIRSLALLEKVRQKMLKKEQKY